jgi:hypothetical protein
MQSFAQAKINLTWTAIANLTPTIGMRGQIRRKFIKITNKFDYRKRLKQKS